MTAKQIVAEVKLRTKTKLGDIELYRAVGDACDDVKRLYRPLTLSDSWAEAIIEATIRRLPQ